MKSFTPVLKWTKHFYKIFLGSIFLFLFVSTITAQRSTIIINEILYHQDASSNDVHKDHEWIELYNSGNYPVNVRGWTISSRNHQALVHLPKIVIPANSYLTVHFRQGKNDLNFSDTEGHYYTQDKHYYTNFFKPELDEVALCRGNPSYFTMEDFVAWKDSKNLYRPGLIHFYAYIAGLWDYGDFFNATDNAGGRVQKVGKGSSIGRDQLSIDTNQPEDWGFSGGMDAIDITISKKNLSILEMLARPPVFPDISKEWTVLVYLDGDNHFEGEIFQDLQEMEVAGSNDDINIVFQVDWARGFENVRVSMDGGNNFFPTTGTWRGYLEPEQIPENERVWFQPVQGENPYVGEKNMANPNTLREFIHWGMTRFPASNYAVIIVGPGAGWKASTYDKASRDFMEIGDLSKALSNTPAPIDLIGFDEGLMGMIEVAYQVSENADVFVASQEEEMATGWPYTPILEALKANPGFSAQQLGKQIVEDYHHHYTVVDNFPAHTLSAIDLKNGFDDLIADVSEFGKELKTGIEDYQKHYDPTENVQMSIKEELHKIEHFKDVNYIDLAHFAQLIQKNSNIPGQYKTKAPSIDLKLDPLGGLVIAEKHGQPVKNAHGLSIYFPAYQTKKWRKDPFDEPKGVGENMINKKRYFYDADDCQPNPRLHPVLQSPDFRFPAKTQWDEFLHRYYEPVADAGVDKVVLVDEVFTLDGSGSSDADGSITKWLWDVDHTKNTDNKNIDYDCKYYEKNDDANLSGKVVQHSYSEPGVYVVTLTVEDDHHTLQGHKHHHETDQDEVIITVLSPDIELSVDEVVLESADKKDLYRVRPKGRISYGETIPRKVSLRLKVNGETVAEDKTFEVNADGLCPVDAYCEASCKLNVSANPEESLSVIGNCEFTLSCMCASPVINLPSFDNIFIPSGAKVEVIIDPDNKYEELYEDDNSAQIILEKAPPTCNDCTYTIFCDSFENYEQGNISTQSEHWRKWSIQSLDGTVFRNVGSEGHQSLYMAENLESNQQQDILLLLGDRFSGKYSLNWDMLVTKGSQGYFNLQKFQDAPGEEFGFEVFFYENELGRLKVGGQNHWFEFVQSTWMQIQLYFDLDQDKAQFYLNEHLIHSWPLHNRSSGTSGIRNLGAINFYAGDLDNRESTHAQYYIDRLCYQDIHELPKLKTQASAEDSANKHNITALSAKDLKAHGKQTAHVENRSGPSSIHVFPNPSKGILKVELASSISFEGTLKILDVQGREKRRKIVSILKENNRIELDLTDLPAGLYFVQVLGGEQILQKKIVIQ